MARYTQAEVDNLRKAIASGVLLVDHNGSRVRYRSLDDMKRTLLEMEEDVEGKPRVRRTIAIYKNGARGPRTRGSGEGNGGFRF